MLVSSIFKCRSKGYKNAKYLHFPSEVITKERFSEVLVELPEKKSAFGGSNSRLNEEKMRNRIIGNERADKKKAKLILKVIIFFVFVESTKNFPGQFQTDNL